MEICDDDLSKFEVGGALPGVSHFAPLRRPGQFNSALLAFLGQVLP